MNIKMSRNGDETITYLVNNKGLSTQFDYVSMIKLLYNEKEIHNTEFEGVFSEEERASIEEMVDNIAKAMIPIEVE